MQTNIKISSPNEYDTKYYEKKLDHENDCHDEIAWWWWSIHGPDEDEVKCVMMMMMMKYFP